MRSKTRGRYDSAVATDAEPGEAASPDRFRRVLVVGASSATGVHLCAELERGCAGTLYRASRVSRPGDPRALAADLRDARATRAMVDAARPTLIVHLAAARADPHDCRRVNVDGTRHLLEAAAAQSAPPAFFFVSSSAVYGAGGSSPLPETAPLRPVGPYGATKAEAEALVRDFSGREGLDSIIARPFNLVGPGLRRGTAPADFAQRLREIQEGRAFASLRVGSLDTVRDFVDVRDAVRAYLALASSDVSDGSTFNVATGVGVSIGFLLTKMIERAGVSVEIESQNGVPSGVAVQFGDASALREVTGWAPSFTLERSLAAMLS